MSFGTYARKVGDSNLPFRHRVGALRSCVQLYQPIGYHAGLSFLDQIAGRFETDEAALLRALNALVHSRRLWHEDVRAFSEMRRAAKLRGQRAPDPRDRNPSNYPRYWYGMARSAALHALKPRSGGLPASDATGEQVRTLAIALVAANGVLTAEQRHQLRLGIDELSRRAIWTGTPDWQASARAWSTLKLARLIEAAADDR